MADVFYSCAHILMSLYLYLGHSNATELIKPVALIGQ